MSYFLRASFLVEALKEIEEGLLELDDLLNDRDVNTEFAELQALLQKRLPVQTPTDGSSREAWHRVRQSGRIVRNVLATTERATALLRAMPCEPLLYTGAGDTDTILRTLNQLLKEHGAGPQEVNL